MSKQTSISSFFKPLGDMSQNVRKDSKRAFSGDNERGGNAIIKSAKLAVDSPAQQKKMASLVSESQGLLTGFGYSWLPVLENEFKKPYFATLCKFVASERQEKVVFPPAEDVFSWTRASRPIDIKVVILGQDPYHGMKQAHGLCFSVLPGISIPPSLQNMYTELSNDIPGFTAPKHGYLMGWANQGVLLLNAVLTVQQANANSHKDKGWEKITDAVITYLNSNSKNIVFLLWGSYAQKKGDFINKAKHCVLKAPHPSPLSAHRGFFGSKPFSQANTYLKSKGREEIDWASLSESA